MNGIILLLLAIFCQNPHHTPVKNSNVTTYETTVDDSGDTGHVPPKPPTPPTNP